MGKTVAVLMGGMSAEREVSMETGRAIAAALRELGHQAVEVEAGTDLATVLERIRPDAAFLALHGRLGEDGTVQGLLEMLRIPYTGSGVLSSAVCMDKVMTKQLLDYHGIPVVEDVVVKEGDDLEMAGREVASKLGFPVMVKPATEGSSIGVTRVDGEGTFGPALEEVFRSDRLALVERYVEGRLLTVGIIGDRRVLPVLEIKTRDGFYDYDAKYRPGRTEYIVPAELDPGTARRAQETALESFDVLRCEGVARIDLMLEGEELVVLEVNTIPGMTSASLLPKAAQAVGVGFNELVAEILAGARLKIRLAG